MSTRSIRTSCVVWSSTARPSLAWRLSNTLRSDSCTAARKEAIARYGTPEIFHTDPGSQFTSAEFTGVLIDHKVRISMNGCGRGHDNIFVERLWWTVKHEWVHLRPCDNGIEPRRSLAEFFDGYHRRRPHPSLAWQTPDETCFGALAKTQALAA